MTVGELIERLSHFPEDLEVTITDGYNAQSYRGDFEVVLFEYDDEQTVDIGIGGFEFNEE